MISYHGDTHGISMHKQKQALKLTMATGLKQANWFVLLINWIVRIWWQYKSLID